MPTPRSAEPGGAPLDPARARLLRLLAGSRAGSSAATIRELAQVVGGHPNSTRYHLRELVAAGLVEAERTPGAGGRGRPATGYALTRAGREAASAGRHDTVAEEYVALAAAFAERLAERESDATADARAIGRTWGAALVAHEGPEVVGDDPPSSRERVLGLLDRLGFSPQPQPQPEPEPVPVPAPGSVPIVLLRTCPLLTAARRHPEVVCEVHHGLVAGALEAFDEPVAGLRLVPFARPGACVLALPATLAQ